MSDYEIILFYKYVHIDDPARLVKEQKALQERLDLKGRTLIAPEGINATIEGRREDIAEYLNFFLSDPNIGYNSLSYFYIFYCVLYDLLF